MRLFRRKSKLGPPPVQELGERPLCAHGKPWVIRNYGTTRSAPTRVITAELPEYLAEIGASEDLVDFARSQIGKGGTAETPAWEQTLRGYFPDCPDHKAIDDLDPLAKAAV